MMVLVLIVSVLMISALGVAVSAAESGLHYSAMFKTDSQGEMAAQTGLATELTEMEDASSYTGFPCTLDNQLNVPGAASAYSATVAYSDNGTALPCSGSTLGGTTAPTNATLTSTGKAPQGSTVVMKEDVQIAVTPTTPAEVGYAIFTSNNIELANDPQLYTGTCVMGSNPPGPCTPDIYAGQAVTCANGMTTSGNVTTYNPVDLAGACTIGGNLTSAASVQLQNSATVKGYVKSYGGNTAATSCGYTNSGTRKNPVYTYYAICLSGISAIDGNATETNGNIEVPDGTIGGNAYASGTISVSGGGVITGTQTPGDSALSSETMPPESTFPTLTLPTSGWNVVSIPNSTYTCAQYFQSISNEASGTSVAFPDPFQQALESQSTKTIYDAPSCDVAYSNAQVFALNPTGGDAVLDVASLTLNNSNTFCEESAQNSDTCSTATSPGPSLVLEANGPPPVSPATYTCSTSTVDMTFNNSTVFEPNVDVLLYSLGQVQYANSSGMTGQIQACGGLTGTNSFSLTFDNQAADEIYGGGTSSITISVEDKYIASG
ncbi:MAG: hypothetical protein ACYCSF_08905 [Acidimicrobiales bacterium]